MTNTFVANAFDWTRTIAQANAQARQEFETTVLKGDGLVEDQLAVLARDFEHRDARALEAVKRERRDPEPMFLSSIRNWARGKAIGLLRDKQAGKSIRPDYMEVFENALRDEIIYRVAEVERAWKDADDHAAVARQTEQEQAFRKAHPYVIELYEAVIKGERQRQDIFHDGVQAAEKWANNYEESVKVRERLLEEREKRLKEREDQTYEHQRAMRQLMLKDQRVFLADNVVSTGRNALNTLGCLLIWVLLVVGILAAIYFAFPHH